MEHFGGLSPVLLHGKEVTDAIFQCYREGGSGTESWRDGRDLHFTVSLLTPEIEGPSRNVRRSFQCYIYIAVSDVTILSRKKPIIEKS